MHRHRELSQCFVGGQCRGGFFAHLSAHAPPTGCRLLKAHLLACDVCTVPCCQCACLIAALRRAWQARCYTHPAATGRPTLRQEALYRPSEATTRSRARGTHPSASADTTTADGRLAASILKNSLDLALPSSISGRAGRTKGEVNGDTDGPMKRLDTAGLGLSGKCAPGCLASVGRGVICMHTTLVSCVKGM